MERFWRSLAVEAGKRAGLVALVTLALTVVFAFGITRLEFATGQDSYLDADDQVAIDNVRYQELFGGQAMLVLFSLDEGVDHVDFMSAQNQAELDRMADELRAREDLVEAVVTPRTALVWSDALVQSDDGIPTNSIAGQALLAAIDAEPTEEGRQARTTDSLRTLERLEEIPVDERVLENPDWLQFVLFDNRDEIRKSLRSLFTDESHAQMLIRLPGNADIDTESAGVDLVRAVVEGAEIEGATLTVTGAPILLQEINDYLQGGMLQLGALAALMMMVILVLLFDVRWRLLALGVILLGVLWAFGLAGYLGIPLTLVTIAGLPVMLGIGIDYAIQMHARVEEEVLIDREEHPIQETARNLGPALLIVTFTAVFAFAALSISEVPMIRDFGLLLAVGIVVICLTSILLPLALLGIREYRSPTTGRDFREGKLAQLTRGLGSTPHRFAPVFALVGLVIFVGGLLVEEDLEIESDPVEWVDQDGRGIQDYRFVEESTGSSSEFAMFVEADDVFGQDTVDFVYGFADEMIDTYPAELLTATSVVTTIAYLLEIPGATPMAPRAEDVQAAYEIAPPDVQLSTVNPDEGAMNLVFRYGAGPLEERAVVVNEIRDNVVTPEGLRATPSGLAVIGVALLDNIQSNRILLTYLAIGLVGLYLSLRLRSPVRALLALVPVLIAVGAASLVAYALGLRLSPMTAVGGPLVVAVCTEFTSLILLRYLEERHRGLTPKAASDVAAARTGRAFVVSALTTMTGVLVIATSSLPLLRDFGLVVALNVSVALVAALVVLPPLLVWADQRGWVSRGIVPPEALDAEITEDIEGNEPLPV
jgi:uncharacterized protein